MINRTLPAKPGGLEAMSREDFLRFFINRPFYRIAGQVYDFFYSIRQTNYCFRLLDDVYEDIIEDLGKLGTMAEFIKDLQGSERITKYYEMVDASIWRRLSISMKDPLFELIEQIFEKARGYIERSEKEPELSYVLEAWAGDLDFLIAPEDICTEGDGFIPEEELDELISTLDLVTDMITDRFIITRSEIENAFLPFILSTGIVLNNDLYRDIYDCMKLAKLIGRDQLRVHDASKSKYVRENFIKAKFTRLQSSQKKSNGRTIQG